MGVDRSKRPGPRSASRRPRAGQRPGDEPVDELDRRRSQHRLRSPLGQRTWTSAFGSSGPAATRSRAAGRGRCDRATTSTPLASSADARVSPAKPRQRDAVEREGERPRSVDRGPPVASRDAAHRPRSGADLVSWRCRGSTSNQRRQPAMWHPALARTAPSGCRAGTGTRPIPRRRARPGRPGRRCRPGRRTGTRSRRAARNAGTGSAGAISARPRRRRARR